ncbi:hypothetical protein ACWERV_03405 [Streptomyces sp. NPDC004031]
MPQLAELTLADWNALDPAGARRLAREAAAAVGGKVLAVEEAEGADAAGGVAYRALIARAEREFALIPGGTAALGFDLERWAPGAEQAADYAASAAQGFGHGADLRAHLAGVLSPARRVRLGAFLAAVRDEALDEPPAGTAAVLAGQGLRMPSPDEWEYACGAGRGTLFRWGDTCPLDTIPLDGRDGPHAGPNAFGLRIAHDTYRAELSTDPGAVHGGDGGESVCGGYGNLLGWLPLATANRNPGMAEYVHGPEGEDCWEDCSTRPVLPL